MDRSGFVYPQHPCVKCDRPLNANGDHPAEIYAPTYDGMCDPCNRRAGFVEATARLDGALKWSYPPVCPSYRRQRERYFAYHDCVLCSGTGYHWKRDAYDMGSYRHYCEACSNRYWYHPLRAWYTARCSRIYHAAETSLERRLFESTGAKFTKNKNKRRQAIAKLPQETINQYNDIVVSIYKRAHATLARLCAQRRIFTEDAISEATTAVAIGA